MKFWKVAVIAIFTVILLGCGKGRYQAPQQVDTPISGVTKSQVKSSILGAETQGRASFGTWKMKVINDSTIQASLFNRGYETVVNIIYTANGYSIKYMSASDNLKDNNGNVHYNYHRWVNKLDTKIRKNIFMTKE